MRTIKSFVILIATSQIYGCGPGVFDEKFRIAGEYSLLDSGGDGRFIIREPSGQKSSITINARVDQFIVDKEKIVIARRPLRVLHNSDGSSVGHIEDGCEYWIIDIKRHESERLDFDPRVSCRS